VHFSAADSHRLRGGARFTYAINEYVSPYIGAAYEHEFDGRAKATTYGYAIQSPNLRGDTGLGELGFSLRPSPDLPISFDLGGQLYTGKREGVSGSVQMKYEF
jgi:outer membrane autotransporter protein